MLRDHRLARRNELDKLEKKALKRRPYKRNRHFTLYDKQRMVSLRFGSLTDFRFKRRTYAEVAAVVKCWVVNVYLTIQRFIKNGYMHPPDGRTVRVVRPEILPTMIDWITSKKTLEAWSHHSLLARVELLKRKYPNHRFNISCLRNIYTGAGITFTKREKVPWKSMHKAGLDQERSQFAVKLAEWIRDKREIIYFDEMSVNLWSITERSLRCW